MTLGEAEVSPESERMRGGRNVATTGIAVSLVALSFILGGLVGRPVEGTWDGIRLALYCFGVLVLFAALMLNTWMRS